MIIILKIYNTIAHNSIANIDNSINIDNDNIIDKNINNIDNNIDYTLESSIVNIIDSNLDIRISYYILDPKCMNKRYSFKAIYQTDSENENIAFMNYIPNKIINMIVDSIVLK